MVIMVKFVQKVLMLYVLFFASLSNQSLFAENALVASDPETRLAFTLFRNTYPEALNGASIAVFGDPSDKRERYYIQPYFIPDLTSFSKSINDECKNLPGDTIISVPLSFEISSKTVSEQVVAELSQVVNDKISLSQLHSYPYAMLTITTGDEDPLDDVQSSVRFRFPPGVSDTIISGVIANTVAFQNLLGKRPIRLRDSCDQLMAISLTGDISAQIYSQYKQIKRNATLVELRQFSKSKSVADLFREESASGEKTGITRSSGGAVGINFGGLFGGGSDSSTIRTSIHDTRRRAISGNLIQSAAREYEANLSVTRWTELKKDGIQDDALVKTLVDYVTSRSDFVMARFNKTDDNQWAITVGEHTRSVSVDEVKMLQDTSVSPELAMSGKETFDCGMIAAAATGGATEGAKKAAEASGKGENGKGKDCSAERDMTYKDSRGIKWEHDGADWVPTSVDLYITSKQKLDTNVVASAEEAIVDTGSGFLKQTLQLIESANPRAYTRADVDEALEKKIRYALDGPPKRVKKIKGGIYKTISYWSKGAKNRTTLCLPAIKPINAMTQIDGKDTRTWDARKGIAEIPKSLGCKPAGHCDSHGEFCVSYERNSGCFVNTDWLAWYRNRIKSLRESENISSICAL